MWFQLSIVQTSLEKQSYEYVRTPFGFYTRSPISTRIGSLGMYPAMNLLNSFISHKFLAQNAETVESKSQLLKTMPLFDTCRSRHLMGVHAQKRGFTPVAR